ncbi:MAG: TetR/AcrR family transcriptional regulator [Pseudomonadota bacterium]
MTPAKAKVSPNERSAGHRTKRNAERSRRAILDAALVEFSEHGHAGARIDNVAERAGVSKPLIYSYFGDKEDLYAAALREAYVQIRAGERTLDLESKDPEAAIRALIGFTLDHFRAAPWFISMLNTENLRGGSSIRRIEDVSEIQSPLMAELRKVLRRGENEGVFRSGVDPLQLYITIASLFYFPLSNHYTLSTVFGCEIDDAWLDQRRADAEEMIIGYLSPG